MRQILGTDRDVLAGTRRTPLQVGSVRSDQGRRGPVVLDSGVGQKIRTYLASAKLGVTQYQLVGALVQHRQPFSRRGGHVYRVAPSPKNRLQRQPGRQLAVYDQDPGQAQPLASTAQTGR